MGWRGTLALVAVVVGLGLLLWVEGSPHPELPREIPNLLGEPRLRDPSKFVPLLAFAPDDVVTLRLRRQNTELTAVREDGDWKAPVESARVIEFLRNLSELGQVMEIPADAGTLQDYGLNSPQTRVELGLRGQGPPLLLEVGNQNPAATGVYVRIGDGGPVILAGALLLWEIDKLLQREPS